MVEHYVGRESRYSNDGLINNSVPLIIKNITVNVFKFFSYIHKHFCYSEEISDVSIKLVFVFTHTEEENQSINLYVVYPQQAVLRIGPVRLMIPLSYLPVKWK